MIRQGAPGRLGAMLITRNFPPVLGGMERLNLHLARALARIGSLCVVAPRGAAAVLSSDDAVTVREVPLAPLWRFGLAAMQRSLGLAWRRRPAWVVAGSGLVAPMAWAAAWVCGARLAIYVHGLDLVARHPLYRAIWPRLIRRADLVIANSAHTAGLARVAGVEPGRIRVLNPGVSLPAVTGADGSAWRRRHGFGDEPLLLSVGRLTERKGLVPFASEVLPIIARARPDVRLVVIGDEPRHALQPGVAGQAARILEAARAQGLASRVHLMGPVDDDELQSAFAAADVHVFPVRELPGDVEGFGMVALEAAAHGLPTVAYAVGGVPDAVGAASGRRVAPADAEGFAAAVLDCLAAGRAPEQRAACRTFAAERTWPHFEAALASVLSQ